MFIISDYKMIRKEHESKWHVEKYFTEDLKENQL